MSRPLKVFLSHAHADATRVRALHNRLVADGVDSWLDKEKLIPGQDWEREIRKAVREADVVIVCLSKKFNERGYRQKEVRIALDEAEILPEGEIFIIPARLEECENLENLRKWHWVDLFEDDGYERLMNALNKKGKVTKRNQQNDNKEFRIFYDLTSHFECAVTDTDAETLAKYLLEMETRIMHRLEMPDKANDDQVIAYETQRGEFFDQKEGKTLQFALIIHGKKVVLSKKTNKVGHLNMRGVLSMSEVPEMLIMTITQGEKASILRFDSDNMPREYFKKFVAGTIKELEHVFSVVKITKE